MTNGTQQTTDSTSQRMIGMSACGNWISAVEMQVNRTSEKSVMELEPDMLMLAVALYQVREWVAHVCSQLLGEDQIIALGALEIFDRRVPYIKDVRHMVLHGPDYVLGKGDSQQPKVKRWKRKPNEDAARMFQAFWFTRTNEDWMMSIGGHTLSVRDASAAAHDLYYVLAELSGPSPSHSNVQMGDE